MSKEKIFEKLRQGLLTYNADEVEKVARDAVADGIDPLEATNVLTDTIKELGEKFGRMEIFLPELMMAAQAMKAGIAVLEPVIKASKKSITRVGTCIVGTVKGDIHDIGKTIVSTMLTASGFTVIDVGNDVPPSAFLEAAESNKAGIVCLSALMTTTMSSIEETINYFKEKGVRNKYKIMVGGAPVTKEYADEVEADGYGKDAFEAVDIAKRLVAK